MNITFEQNKIVCTFLDQQGGQLTQISCRVAYGPCQQQSKYFNMTVQGVLSSPNTVDIDLSTVNPQANEYCYAVTASSGSMFTILIDLERLTLSSKY